MEVPEVKIKSTTTYVKGGKPFKTTYTVFEETPDFGMSKEAARIFGIRTLVGYWLWKFKTKKLWKHNSKKN
jgi:hypothetical protein